MEKHKNSEFVEEHVLLRYTLKQKIGSGAYGHVWRVTDKKTKQILALKKIFDAFQNSTDAQRTYRELSVLRQLQHPNIITLHAAIRAENDRDLYLVFQFMDSDLHSVIRENLLLADHHKYIVYQLAKSLKYMHDAQLVHRDLKPSNILINEKSHIKVCDFGLVRFLTSKKTVPQPEQQVLTEHVATRWYRSPQILLGSHKYGKSTDIWSFGCIFAEMLICRPLFPGKTTMDQLERVFAFTGMPTEETLQLLDIPNVETLISTLNIKNSSAREALSRDLDPDAFDLLSRMLCLNPDQRIQAGEILMHPYVQQFREDPSELESSVEPIPCDINDNKKLSVKEYRNLIYELIKKMKDGGTWKGWGKDTQYPSSSSENTQDQQPAKKFSNQHVKVSKQKPVRLSESKSQWISPYLRENKLLARSPYLKELSSNIAHTLNKSMQKTNSLGKLKQSLGRTKILINSTSSSNNTNNIHSNQHVNPCIIPNKMQQQSYQSNFLPRNTENCKQPLTGAVSLGNPEKLRKPHVIRRRHLKKEQFQKQKQQNP